MALHQPRLGVEAEAAGLVDDERPQPVGREQPRRPGQRRAGHRSVRPVGLAQDVRRRPLQHRDVGRAFGEVRHELDGARPRAEHGDAPTGHVVVVVPLGRVELRAGEGVQTRHVRPARSAELPARGDQDVRLVRAAVRQGEPPGGPRPRCRQDLGAEADVRQHAEVAGDAPQVGVDLLLGREAARPVALRREGERVQVARDVARRTGVGVVAPDAADVVAALEQDEVALAVLQQPHGGADAPEARPDDGDPRHATNARQWRGSRRRPDRPGS